MLFMEEGRKNTYILSDIDYIEKQSKQTDFPIIRYCQRLEFCFLS